MARRRPNGSWLLPLAILGFCGPLFAQVSTATCTSHECSNDFIVPGYKKAQNAFYGDELFEWDALAQWSTRSCPDDRGLPCVTADNQRCYELALFPQLKVISRRCDGARWLPGRRMWGYSPPQPNASPYAVARENFPRYGSLHEYVVRVCEGPECGAWGPLGGDDRELPVELYGGLYACFGSLDGRRCESSCYPGAPKRFSQIPDCPDL